MFYFDYENEDEDEDEKIGGNVMNSDQPSREEIELKLTALLLGELPDDEAQLLRWAISQDAELSKLHERLKLTVGFVREAAAHPAAANPPLLAPLKLSDEKREKLLAHFKTIAPREFVPEKKRREISSLLAIAAVIALLALLAAMLLPSLAAAKRKAQRIYNLSPDESRDVADAVVERRVPSLEAYVQNDEPAAKGGDNWQGSLSTTAHVSSAPVLAPPTQIVLPPSDSSAGVPAQNAELAAANPASSADFNFGLARNSGGGFGGGGGGGRDGGDRLANSFAGDAENAPGFQQQLKGINQRVVAASDESISTGLARDDVSGLRYLLGTNAVALDSDATQNRIAGQSEFYRNQMPGDAPAMSFGNSKANGTVSYPAGGDIGSAKNIGEKYAKEGAVIYNGANMTLADDLSKSASGTVALSGENTFSGGAIVNAGTLGVNKDENGIVPSLNAPISPAKPSDQWIVSRSLALGEDKYANGNLASSDSDQLPTSGLKYTGPGQQQIESRLDGQIHTIDTDDRMVQVENSWVQSANPHGTHVAGVASAISPASVTTAPITRMPAPSVAAAPRGNNVTNFTYGSYAFQSSVQSAINEDRPIQKTPSPASVPQPEILTRENAFSTFSLNVSDVSFKLAAASLQNGVLPDAGSIRSEEFINAFDYRDPEPAAGVPVAFVSERARDPFANNRDLLRFSIKTAAQGRQAGRPLNIVLLLDNSGSMERADRVAIIHEALRVLASQLQPQDTLSIVTFARTARLWVDGVSGDHAGEAVSKVSELTPEGGTNLEEAMKLAYATALRHYLANGGNRVVLLTDGAANLGNVDPVALKQQVEAQRKQGIALDCFGIGWEGYNDDLLEQLSSNGDGRYGFINTPEEAATGFAAQLAGALQVAAEDVKVQVEFNPQRVISYRQIGYAKHQLTKEQFRDNTVAAAPLAAQEAGNALYTVEINPQGEGPVATVHVRFRIPGTQEVSEHEWPVPFNGGAPALEQSSPALRLASTASAFSEWLAQSPFAQEVTTDQLLNYLNGVPEIYGADPRPKKLEWMIRQAKSLSGK